MSIIAALAERYFQNTVCRAAYKKLTPSEMAECNKFGQSLKRLREGVDELDNTSCKMARLADRSDLIATVSASSILKGLLACEEIQIFVMGLLFLLYWAAPITSALTAFVQKGMIMIPRGTAAQNDYTRKVLAVMKLITKMYKPLCIAGSAIIPRDAKRLWKIDGHF